MDKEGFYLLVKKSLRKEEQRRKGKKDRGRGEGVGGGGLEERQVGKRVKVALVVRNHLPLQET